MLKDYKTKIKHILPTYLLVVFGTLIVLLSFRWIFSINTNIISIKEEYFELWLPFILPWIPITIWLRPKLRILKFKNPSRDTVFHQAIVWITMVVMLMTSNHYLTESNAKFNSIYAIEDLKENDAKYISIDRIQLDKTYGSSYTDFSYSGKYNQYLNFNIYFVYPFKTNNISKYWYGKKYHRQVSNRLNDFEKEQQYRRFLESSTFNFENYRFSEPNYFEVLQNSNKKDGFINAVNRAEVYTPGEIVIIEPKNGEYSDDNSKSFYWIFGAFGIGIVIFLIALLFPRYDKTEHKRQLRGIKPKSDDLVDMIKFLIPKDPHYVTSILINLNIIVFIIMIVSGINIMSPKGIELLEFGGNRRAETLGGEWWRLITNIFIHGGIIHLFLNIVGLSIGSFFIEPIFSRTKYILIYFLSGIGASLASIFWHNNTISVGASGAIFGIYGALFGLMLTKAMPSKIKKTMFIFLGPYVGINLLMGLTDGIDNAAHIGGLLSGVIISILIYIFDGKSIKNRF